MKKTNGFTIIELIVVVIVVGIIAVFAIPQYNKVLLKSDQRDAVLQLTALHGAMQNYIAKNGTFPDTGGVDKGAAWINTTFGVNVSDGLNYEWEYESPDYDDDDSVYQGDWEFEIEWYDDTDHEIEIELNPGPLSSINPCCDADNAADCLIPSCP